MLLPGREKRILKDLIGRKIESVLYPDKSASLPVEVYIVLNGQVLKVDSCSRQQQPTETARYPQLRVSHIRNLPPYIRLKSIPVDNEIVTSVEVLDEEYQSPKDFVIYTKGIRICCTGNKKISILRNSYREAGLKVSLSDLLSQEEKRESDVLHFERLHY